MARSAGDLWQQAYTSRQIPHFHYTSLMDPFHVRHDPELQATVDGAFTSGPLCPEPYVSFNPRLEPVRWAGESRAKFSTPTARSRNHVITTGSSSWLWLDE